MDWHLFNKGANEMQMLRCRQVLAKCGISNATLYRYERNAKFPARRQLGPGLVAWELDAVESWLAALPYGPAPRDTTNLKEAKTVRANREGVTA